MEIPGVPEAIPRAQVLALVESLGLDWKELRKLEFGTSCITAEVYALDANGHRYVDQRPDREPHVAMHRLTIKIVEEPWPVPASPSTTATT
jgi:hypothetical protein